MDVTLEYNTWRCIVMPNLLKLNVPLIIWLKLNAPLIIWLFKDALT